MQVARWLGIYRRAHSFLLAGHFIRTGSWLSRTASPHLARRAISYKCVVNYLPRDTAVLLHRCSSLPHSPHPFCSTDPSPPPTAFRLHHLRPPSLFLSLYFSFSLSYSRVIPRSRFCPLRAVSIVSSSSSSCNVMAPRVKETNVYLKN